MGRGSSKSRRLPGFLGLLLVPLLVIYAIPFVFVGGVYRTLVNLSVWWLWCRRGKDVFYMSSQSPVWREYMETHILPLVQERAVIVDWTERRELERFSLKAAVARSYSREKEFNPIVVLFRPFHMRREFRFHGAFREYKHGKPEKVEVLRTELIEALKG
jgi:hypothetical protein